ncbi:MAG TPA: TolC family protein [Gemmatimonadaceae bacterium]|nr:TolC family protein [Gemmatimonadaceae bacterium]
MSLHLRYLSLVLSVAAFPAATAAQQGTTATGGSIALSLADAVRIAERESEAVRIARAGTSRAQGQQLQANSQRFPQVVGSANYQRALQLQFEEIVKRLGGDDTSSSGGGFADSPLARVFASPNTMVLGISATQTLYAGGRVRAGVAAANAGRRAADHGERAARAQNIYEVAQAYFDAQVAERLLAIADSSFAQTERALRQTQLAREVGNTSEYNLIRARVQRDNARPVVISARAQRDVALLHLRQMLNLPLDRAVSFTTAIDGADPSAGDVRAATDLLATTAAPDVTQRSVVQQAAENVRAMQEQLRATRGARLPSVALSTNYQRFAYPSGVFEDELKMYFPNWTVSVGVSMPLFTAGAQRGAQLVAEANLAEARERLTQAREAAALDSRLAAADLEQAEAAFAASAGTDEQAARAYSISEVRFAEGIGTQLELTQARVDLETARATRIRAARDVALARLRVALMPYLPLGVGAR